MNYTEIQELKLKLMSMDQQIRELLKSSAFNTADSSDDQKEKIAVYSVTADRFNFLRASIRSLFFNSDVDKVIVISDASSLPEDFPKDVNLITIKKAPDYILADGPNVKTSFSLYCLLRLAFHRIFPQYNKILSLDYDTIVKKDISDLWDIQLGENYYLAGVSEADRTRGSVYGYYPKRNFKALSTVIFKHLTYVNAGVMLMNLRKLREDGTGDEMIKLLNENEYALPEQDIINTLCHRNLYLLPDDYNSSNLTKETANPKIIHYARLEKKLDYEDVIPYRDMTWTRVKEHRELNYGKTLNLSGMEASNEVLGKVIHMKDEVDNGSQSWF